MTNSVQKIPIVAFDFCETLVDFQTADAYIDYVRENTCGTRKVVMSILEKALIFFKKVRVIAILEKLTKHKLSLSKRLKLIQLRYKSYESLNTLAQDYYYKVIKPSLIPALIGKMIILQKKGFKIVLASGGYEIYLRYFAQDFKIDDILCTHIKFKNGLCKGTIDGMDCMNENKVKLIKEKYPVDIYELKYAFSDSPSDLPLLKHANEGTVVSYINKQPWAKNNNLNEIIWQN